MQITLEVPTHIIANMMTSAMESGDPVTTSWCGEINLLDGPRGRNWWYGDPNLYAGDFAIEIIELDEEITGHTTTHSVRPADMVRGLTIMATKFPHLFSRVLTDNTDAPCADIFLQCTLFGEEKYA
jgi:hypothetical protein